MKVFITLPDIMLFNKIYLSLNISKLPHYNLRYKLLAIAFAGYDGFRFT